MTQSDIINNNFSKAFECIKCSNAYDTGEVLSEEKLFKQISERKHSTFDLSKFTVVGSPNITDGGVASGFSTSDYLRYLFAEKIDLTKQVIMIDSEYTYNTNNNTILWYNNNDYWRTRLQIYSNGVVVYFSTNQLGSCNTLNNYSFKTGDKIRTIVEYNNTYIKITLYINGIYNNSKTTTYSSLITDTLYTNVDNIAIGGCYNAQYIQDGSIDLKQFSITVDGKEVFSGNKTGIDVINDIEIPYTLSKTGSKIVDVAYRDRVIDLYEQEGQAGYYTIDEPNKNFTLPMGEIYGMAVRKDLSNLSEVGEKHFLNKSQITNCLTEVPQRIKADIVDGTLTVYAGSICIVPYGTDAPTYSVGDFLLGEANNNLYKIVDIQYDANIDYPVLDQPLLFYTVEVQRDLSRDVSGLSTSTVYLINLIVNSTIETSLDIDYCDVRLVGTTNSANNKYLVYDTTTNYVLSDTGHYSVGTLPVLVYNNREFLNVFDCVGFIGNTVYIHKNISMLMGIGKNPDGSQKNIEYTTDKLFVHKMSPTSANYFYYVGFENGVSINPDSKKLIFDNPNTTFVGSSSLGTFINGWKMWNFRTGKWEFYSSKMNNGVPFQVHNAIFGRLWFEDGKIIRIYLNPTGMLKTDEEKGFTTSEQDSLSTMNVPASETNLNSFRKAGTYYFSGSHKPISIPGGSNGILQVITNEERTLVKQIWFRHGTINSNDTQTWIRTYAPTNTETNTYGWSNWQLLIPQFQFKKANPGFLKSGNMIVQGGSYKMSSNGGDKVITFPTAFSSTNYCIIAKRMGSDDNDYESGATFERKTTSCKIHSWGNYTYSWIAFGY